VHPTLGILARFQAFFYASAFSQSDGVPPPLLSSSQIQTCASDMVLVLLLGCLTVCVTRAGAGGGTPSDWENAEA